MLWDDHPRSHPTLIILWYQASLGLQILVNGAQLLSAPLRGRFFSRSLLYSSSPSKQDMARNMASSVLLSVLLWLQVSKPRRNYGWSICSFSDNTKKGGLNPTEKWLYQLSINIWKWKPNNAEIHSFQLWLLFSCLPSVGIHMTSCSSVGASLVQRLYIFLGLYSVLDNEGLRHYFNTTLYELLLLKIISPY